jgi:GxxExxY protein
MVTKDYIKDLTYKVIGAAIEVHKEIGPGLLESVYQKCMECELRLRGIKFASQTTVPIIYKGITLESELRADLIVEDCLIVELKAVQELIGLYDAQVLSYMKLAKKPKGVLINFCVSNVYDFGQKTYVNEIFRILPER